MVASKLSTGLIFHSDRGVHTHVKNLAIHWIHIKS